MKTLAYQPSTEDVENVLRSNSLDVANSNGKSFASMSQELFFDLDIAKIEEAAINGDDMDAQADFANDEIARQLREKEVLEPLRSILDQSQSTSYEIRVNGMQLMTGDATSIGVVFNNFDGRNFATPSEWREQTYAQWLAFMSVEFQTKFEPGMEIQMRNPEGAVLESSAIGRGSPVEVGLRLVSKDRGFDDYDVSGHPIVGRVSIGHGIKTGDLFNVYGSDGSKQGARWRGSVEKSLGEFLNVGVVQIKMDMVPTQTDIGRTVDEPQGTGKAAAFDPTSPDGYAKVLADDKLQLAYQDDLDALFQQRIVGVLNELRQTGWQDSDHRRQLRKGDVAVEFDRLNVGAGANVVGGVWTLLRVGSLRTVIGQVPDDLSLDATGLAQSIDQVQTVAVSRMERNLSRAPQELSREEFSEVATAKKLVNHGRQREVFFGENSMGFCDSQRARDALGEAHKRVVNNAIYAHHPDAPDFLRPCVFPPDAVLDQYPELREKFADVLDARRTATPQWSLDFGSAQETATPAQSAASKAVDRTQLNTHPKEGTFVGKIMAVADGVVTQKVGRDGRTVDHPQTALSKSVAVGEVVEIKYANGQGRVQALDKSKDRGIS